MLKHASLTAPTSQSAAIRRLLSGIVLVVLMVAAMVACGFTPAPSDVATTDEETVWATGERLGSGALTSINGTYGGGCIGRSGPWSVSIGGGGIAYPALSVVTNNAACVLTLTQVVTSTTTTLSSAIPLSSTYAASASTAPSADGTFSVNATLSATTFAANFTLTVLYSADPATGTGAVTRTAAVVPAHVQSTGVENDCPVILTTVSKAFASNNTAGNAIIAALSWDTWTNPGSITCTDTRGNTYQTIAVNYDLTNNQHLAVCYATNIAAGANTVSATLGAGQGCTRLVIAEYSGIRATYAVDTVATNMAVGGAANLANDVTSGSATTSSPGDLIFGALEQSDEDVTITAGTGFTKRYQQGSTVLFQDKIQTAATSVASTNTSSGASRRYTSHMIAFRSASAVPAPSIPGSDGIMVFGTSNTVPRLRSYDNTADSFSSVIPMIGTPALNMVVRTSPTKHEAIAAWTDGNNLHVACYDGTGWSIDWHRSIQSIGTTVAFDVAYETNSGDSLVLFATNMSTTSLGHRTKSGAAGCGASNWAAESLTDPVRTGGVARTVKLAPDRRASSDRIAAVWGDDAGDLGAGIWTGSAWGNEPSAVLEASLQNVSVSQDVDNFDVEYSSTSGDVMVVWGASNGSATVNGAYYARCTGGTATCTWGSKTQIGTGTGDDATHLDISANPASDEIVFASIGKLSATLQMAYWSGSAWSMTANADTTATTPTASTRYVATGWLTGGGATRSIVTYYDAGATNIGWYTGNIGVFTAQTDQAVSPSFGAQRWYDIQMDPLHADRLMFVVVDANNDLFAKRLVMTSGSSFTWTNADSGAALEPDLWQTVAQPASFAYWRYP